MTEKVVVNTGLAAFGGSRIPGAVSSANLWSDGVVIASAWTTSPDSHRAVTGRIFTFRGTVTKGFGWAQRPVWRLVEDRSGAYIGTFTTRRAAVEQAEHEAVMDLFRALNAAEAADRKVIEATAWFDGGASW